MKKIPLIKTAVCFIEAPKGKILILKRNPLDPQGNTWGLVGGKIEPNETSLAAIKREVEEEAGLSLLPDNFKFIGKHKLHYPEMLVDCYTYKTFVTKTFKPRLNTRESIDYKWISYNDCYKMNDLMEGLYELLEKIGILKATKF